MFVLVGLFILTITPSYAEKQVPKVAIDLSHGQGKEGLEELKKILVENGFEPVFIIQKIDKTVLENVKILIVGEPFYEEYKELGDDELKAIVEWFNEGGKMLWVSGACDYNGTGGLKIGYEKIEFANKILSAVGAKIRVEPASLVKYSKETSEVLDVIADQINPDKEVKKLTVNVSKVLFYGSTIVCGYERMFGFLPVYSYIPLEIEKAQNVFWLIKTGPHSIIFTADERSIPYAHEPYKCPLGELPLTAVCVCGKEPWKFEEEAMGIYVVMAVEKYAGPKQNNKIVVSGSSPYGEEKSLILPVYHGILKNITLGGPILIKNIVLWGAKTEKAPRSPLFYPMFLLVVIPPIIVVLVYLKLKTTRVKVSV